MSGGIFIVKKDKLIELNEAEYDSEDILQELLTKYPNLLAGKQIDSKEPRRWLLVKRELGIPDREAGGDRWSVDHLFLDQDGIPTLVEVKRSTDTRIRREVVGQMLDYAANAITFWPVSLIEEQFVNTTKEEGRDPQEVFNEFLGEAQEDDDFWEKVESNLKAGKVRLLFVADVIPQELQRIIEFLNEKMDSVQVLGIEIKQYKGSNTQSFVPRVIGQTAEAQIKKQSSSARKKWDEHSFFAELSNNVSDKGLELSRLLYDELNTFGVMDWGTGVNTGSYSFKVQNKDESLITLMHQWSDGNIDLLSGYFYDKYPKLAGKYEKKVKNIRLVELDSDKKYWGRIKVSIDDLSKKDIQNLISLYNEISEEVKNKKDID